VSRSSTTSRTAGRVGLKLTYVWDTEDVKGTCSSLINAINQGALKKDETLLVYYGDILTNLDLTELVEKHFSEKAAATLAVSPNYQLPVGVVEINDGRVTAMREKPSIPINVTIGILTLEAHHITETP
jgi:mannose-1-phosphate guanylyltransferase